jgi:hypothetical protein
MVEFSYLLLANVNINRLNNKIQMLIVICEYNPTSGYRRHYQVKTNIIQTSEISCSPYHLLQ